MSEDKKKNIEDFEEEIQNEDEHSIDAEDDEEILEDEHKWQSNGPECLKKSFRHMMECLGLN